MPGAESVHDCILDAIASSRAFVGGYKHYGVEGAIRFVYLGSSEGYWYYTQGFHENGADNALRRTRCTAIVDAPGDPSITIGLECVDGEALVEVRDPLTRK